MLIIFTQQSTKYSHTIFYYIIILLYFLNYCCYLAITHAMRSLLILSSCNACNFCCKLQFDATTNKICSYRSHFSLYFPLFSPFRLCPFLCLLNYFGNLIKSAHNARICLLCMHKFNKIFKQFASRSPFSHFSTAVQGSGSGRGTEQPLTVANMLATSSNSNNNKERICRRIMT